MDMRPPTRFVVAANTGTFMVTPHRHRPVQNITMMSTGISR